MAHKILKQFMLSLLSLMFLPPMVCMAQYTTNYTWGVADITSQATSGTNAWKYLPGTPVCKLGTLAVGGIDASIWCVSPSPDNHVYQFNYSNGTWVKQTSMGTSVIALFGQGASNLFSLQLTNCGVNGGKQYYGVFHWSGSAWTQPNSTTCVTEATIGVDGFMAGVGWNGTVSSLYSSTNGGTTWSLWSPSWKFVNMSSSLLGCAINNAGQLFVVSTNSNATPITAITGTAAGCANLTGTIVAWNAGGTLYLLDNTAMTWKAISGIVANQALGINKGSLFALDTTGKPYHWNVFAPTVTGAIQGTWDNFPMSPLTPAPQHTGKIKVAFPHGMNTAGQSTQVVQYNHAMNVGYTDTAPLCDMFIGADGECEPVTTGSESCSVAGPIGNPTQNNSGQGQSIEIRGFVYDVNATPVTLIGSPLAGSWTSLITLYTSPACRYGVPTCQFPDPPYIYDLWTQQFVDDGSGIQSGQAWGAVDIARTKSINGQTAPWVYRVPYERNSDGSIECFYPPILAGGNATAMFGDPPEVLPNCQ